MTPRLRASSLALAGIGLATLVFGVFALAFPGDPAPWSRSLGATSIGMGLFGTAIALTAFASRARWAWFCIWYYPLFWAAHFVGDLPPGQDHVHQIVFIVLSLAALLVPAREFFPRGRIAA